MLKAFLNIFKIPELRTKLLFTIGMLAAYRIGYYVAVPGVDQVKMGATSSSDGSGGSGPGSMTDMFQIFTGGNLSQSTIFGLGIMPYISASIILQLLVTVVPALEKLQREGDAGRRKINEYMRYGTVLLCIIQGYIWMSYLANQNLIFQPFLGDFLGSGLRFSYFVMAISMLTAGTLFLMWMGEQIDEYGIGNGISLIIMAGIVAQMPQAVIQIQRTFTFRTSTSSSDITLIDLVFILAMFVAVVAASILITQGQRRIPIQQAKATRGRRVYGGQRQYLPLRVNHGGVMPIIFASSILLFPDALLSQLQFRWNNSFTAFLNSAFDYGSFLYTLTYIAAVYFFAYFWTTVQFQPKEMANNLRDFGSFIPGLRPGKRTADYLERVMFRITYVGAAFLAIIAILPTVVNQWLNIPFTVSQLLGGTGLLIVVSVALDMIQRIEANLIMRNYKGFLGNDGPIRGSRN